MQNQINFGAGFQRFSGWEYLCIDLANHYGLDKELFETRIEWVYENINHLGWLVNKADDPVLFQKTAMQIERARRGEPIGHIVHFDACCSGIQIMSALTGCESGAYNTGMIDPRQRMDAYSNTTAEMNSILSMKGMASITVPRGDVKQAVMTSSYGSKAVPKKVFGEGEMLDVFYDAAMTIAPGAFKLMDELLESWRPFALEHRLVAPDGFTAVIKVMETKETRIEVDELDHATFTLQYRVNEGTERGRANVANTTHFCDAYLLRGMERRCNYNPVVVRKAQEVLEMASLAYSCGKTQMPMAEELSELLPLCIRAHIADVALLPLLDWSNVMCLPKWMVRKLLSIVNDMLTYKPFPIITVHDAFGCHANNCDITRYWYKEIMADFADSDMLEMLLCQLYGITDGKYEKLSPNLGDKIRNSNYALS
nr:MAG: DNA-dependent RNA polymerase [Bacteriophage sp.]